MAVVTTNYSSTSDSTAIPITLAGLATSASLVAGRQTTIVTNVTNKFLDAAVTGRITTGTTPTVNKTIAVYVFVPTSVAASAFTYPVATAAALGEADAAVVAFEAGQRTGAVIFAQAALVSATSDIAYTFSFNVKEVVGYMPLKWGLFVTHDTVAALHATAGNHFFHYVGLKADVV